MMAQACSGRCGTPMLRTQAPCNAFVVSRQHQHSRALVSSSIDNCNSLASCSKGLHQASHQPGPCVSASLGPCWRLRQRGSTLLRPASASFNGLLPSAAPGEPSSQAHAAGSASGAAGQPPYGEFRAPQELQSLVNAIPFRRLAIWLFVGLVAWQLSDFFGLAMVTFILTYIGTSFVDSALSSDGFAFIPEIARRKVLVLLYFGSILAGVTLLGVLTVPDIAAEGADFVRRLQSDNIWVVLVEKMRKGLGDTVMESLEKAIYLASSNDITAAASAAGEWTSERIAALGLTVSTMLKGTTTSAAKITAALLKSVTKGAVQIVISLVLAFMMVWDMPSIKAGVETLRSSRLAPVYDEVAPVLSVFGNLFGKALEVQARIAVVNTALTALGMWFLDIPGMGLLSLFVFVCSFIPIAGCIISTVPIGFVALTEYGFFKLALVILMVMAVHFIEAYMLNPAIYSAHLKLHPLLVLSVLVIAEHAAGVWGLLLAVPVTVFMRDYCIRYPKDTITDVGQKELRVVLASIDGESTEEELVAPSTQQRLQQPQQQIP